MSLHTKLCLLFPTADPMADFRVRDDLDERGPYIEYFNEAKLGPRPTAEQLAAADGRDRRPKGIAALVAEIRALPAQDQQRLQLAIAAAFLRDNPRFARALGIALDGDEVIL